MEKNFLIKGKIALSKRDISVSQRHFPFDLELQSSFILPRHRSVVTGVQSREVRSSRVCVIPTIFDHGSTR